MRKQKYGGKIVYRCTTVSEVIEKITDVSIEELIAIMDKQHEERKTGVVNAIPFHNWIDKYCINPYRINDDRIEFLIAGKVVNYVLDENKKIEACFISKLNIEEEW